ncbi:MAG: DEAD/DEAH box helicase [Treponema sp.]|nr:DEAD/DEAH box helicase [Treponema sp.]
MEDLENEQTETEFTVDETLDVTETNEASDNEEISFEDLGLDETTLAAVERKGFKVPSPIQVLAIPRLLNGDANIIAKARTGTGKTAAFGLPIVQKIRNMNDGVRALVLEPTRELAVQTCTELQSFGDGKFPRVCVLYGGAPYNKQINELKRGVEIVVGTPGRVQDHLERGTLKIDKIDYFILDEGDEMLDMGFVDDIEAIFAQANPNSRILLFSATMPKPILKIAEKFMGDYEICEEEGFVEEPLLIDQSCLFVRESEKIEALVRVIDIAPDFYGLVFTQTKNDADLVSRLLDERGYEVAALHGDIPQGQREKILARFRSRKTRVLVATDVAARGIDINGLTHVINYSLPFDAATYVHRIGRTGRAGAKGTAVTFVRPEERRRLEYLRSAVRRAAKGELIEGTIPSVDDVLNTKRSRMLDQLKTQLGVYVVNEIELTETDAAVERTASPHISVDEVYTKMAEELCETHDAKEVLAGVLSAWYGKTLDKSHYGSIREYKGGRPSKGGAPDPNQKRLYVQLGKRDGYNARALAAYFSGLLHIPGHKVDRIEVTQNFSLLSLPKESAEKVLQMAKRDHSLPHIHLDTQENGSDGFEKSAKGGDSDKGGRRRGFGGKKGGAERDENRRGFGKGDREGKKSRGFKNEHGRAKVHTPTERVGASAYKKSNRKKNEF